MQNHIFEHLVEYGWLRPFILFLEDGQLGVNVFFVISGFLITSLLIQEEEVTKRISLKKFYIRRTLRIFPAYYFLLLFYAILQLLNIIHISDAAWLTAITYTKYFNSEIEWFTAHAWSLSIEEHFYILWPLIFTTGPQVRKWAAIAMIILVPVFRTIGYLYPVDWINEYTILTRVDSIAIGCLFAIYRENILNIISRYWKGVFWFAAITLFFLRYLPSLAIRINEGLAFIFIPLGRTYGTIANFLVALIMMYAIFGPRKLFHKMLNSSILNYIGLLSYSLYLWQQFFIRETENWITQFPQNLIFVFGMAMFSFYLVEKPFLTLKDRFSGLKKSPPNTVIPPVLEHDNSNVTG